MVRRMLIRIGNIGLILVLSAAGLLMSEQYRALKANIEAGEVAWIAEENRTNEVPYPANDPAADSGSASLKHSEGQRPERWEIREPGCRMKGQRLLTHDRGRVFAVNLETSHIQLVYTIEEPWYLVDYDLASDGTVALVIATSRGAIGTKGHENQTRMMLINPASSGDPLTLECAPGSGPDVYEIQTVVFSPDGKYLLVDDRGADWDRFKVYELQKKPAGLRLLKEVKGKELQQLKVIGFDRTSEALYFRSIGENALLYAYNIKKQQWYTLLPDRTVSAYEFTEDGVLFSLRKISAGSQDLQIQKLTGQIAPAPDSRNP